MDLTLQDWGAIGEIVGGAAVVLTLLYLSVQLRQTSNALKASNLNSSAVVNGQVFQELITNPEIVELVQRGSAGLKSLDEPERLRFVMFHNVAMRWVENQYMMYRMKALDADVWQSASIAARELLGTSGGREAWAQNKEHFAAEFRALVDELPPMQDPKILRG